MSEAALLGPAPETPPRMRLGLAGSVLLHATVLSLLVFAHAGAPPLQPPMIHMQLIAAAEGPVQTGVVDAPKADVVVPKTKKPVTPPKPTVPIPATKKVAPSPVAIPITPPPPTAVPAKAAPPAAGGGTGGHGADATNISTSGVPFADQAYLNNIVNEIGRRFPSKATSLAATVTFRIRRDGSVNADSTRVIKPSGQFSFDEDALSAVESAANQKAFGPLPASFTGDGLFVTFIFDGKLRKP